MKISTKTSSVIMVMIATLLFNSAYGTSFTAVASGNWNSSATWGGSAPSNNITFDDIHILSGVNVTMNNDVTFTGAFATLEVLGTLSSAANGTLTMNLGSSISGTGAVNVNNVLLNTGSAVTFTGSFTVNTMTTGIASLITTAHFMINQKITMAASALTIQTNGHFDMGTNGTIEISGGSLTANASSVGLSGNYNVMYTSVSSITGAELTGSGLKDVTINTSSGNTVTLQTDLTVNGNLNLTSGELKLNGHNLIINGDITSGGSATINSTNTSDITINKSTSPSGSIRFSNNGNSVNNFTVNLGESTGYVMMGSDMKVAGTLHFTSGSINTGSSTLDLGTTGMITGSGNSSYVMTGTNGKLSMYVTAGSVNSSTFSVGTTDHYSPAYIQLNSGSSSGSVSIGIAGDIWSKGTTGTTLSTTKSVVKNTWHVYSDISSNMDMNLEVRWSAAMEVNGFNRSSSFISHYTGDYWDLYAQATATAEAGGMYSLQRNHISSLSPFAVFDNASANGVDEVAGNFQFEVYPNPTTDVINIKNNLPDLSGNAHIEIINMIGQVIDTQKLSGTETAVLLNKLVEGNYYIRIYNNQACVVKKLVKL